MLEELELTGIQKLTSEGETAAVFFYTPLCGTCKVARRMVEVALAVRPDLTVYACDLNFAPDIAQRFTIQSVPALVFFEKNQAVRRMYRFPSVEEVLTFLAQRGVDAT